MKISVPLYLSLLILSISACSDETESHETKSNEKTEEVIDDSQNQNDSLVHEYFSTMEGRDEESDNEKYRFNYFSDEPENIVSIIRRGEENTLRFTSIDSSFEYCQDGDSIFIRSGDYYLDESLELWEKNNIVITGEDNCKLIAENEDENVMWIVTCRYIKIRNLHATHAQPTKDRRCYGNVFALDMGEQITIEGCNINGCGAIGVYIFGTNNIRLLNNHIHDNTLFAVEDNGRGMNGPKETENVLFMDNTFEHNGYLLEEDPYNADYME